MDRLRKFGWRLTSDNEDIIDMLERRLSPKLQADIELELKIPLDEAEAAYIQECKDGIYHQAEELPADDELKIAIDGTAEHHE